jgi:hypothetical protein
MGHQLKGDDLYDTFEDAKENGVVESMPPRTLEELRDALIQVDLEDEAFTGEKDTERLMALLDAYSAVKERIDAVKDAPFRGEITFEGENVAERVAGTLRQKRDEIADKICEVLNNG